MTNNHLHSHLEPMNGGQLTLCGTWAEAEIPETQVSTLGLCGATAGMRH